MDDRFSRLRFLLLTAAAQLSGGAIAEAQAAGGETSQKPLKRSLVLSGGGALGAYEAGAVEALVKAAGVGEGQPLPQYGIVAGTSIGAFNAYLVATAQWSKLSRLWSSISDQDVVRLKPEFAKIGEQSSGVINRLAQAFSLGLGAGRNVLGVYDGEFLQSWLEDYLDFSQPIVTPLIWAVTNLTKKRVEYFYLMPGNYNPDRLRLALASMQLSVGRIVPIRPVDRALLPKQLRASAAVPVAFDPVVLPGVDGAMDQYVDGGLTANTPISVARAASSAVDVVILSPPFEREQFDNMFQVTSGSFDTMQRRIMFDAVRSAALESVIYRAVRYLPDEALARLALSSGHNPEEIKIFAGYLYDTNFFLLRPDQPLPATLFGFNDAKSIRKTYDLGFRDATAGFKPFDFQTFDV